MSKHPIYYVIAKASNGDEWVMPDTYDNEREAKAYANDQATKDARFTYRVEHTTEQRQSKNLATSLYGVHNPIRVKQQGVRSSSMPVQPQRGDFTIQELFGEDYEGVRQTAHLCRECGVEVRYYEMLEVHTTWHNKLLP